MKKIISLIEDKLFFSILVWVAIWLWAWFWVQEMLHQVEEENQSRLEVYEKREQKIVEQKEKIVEYFSDQERIKKEIEQIMNKNKLQKKHSIKFQYKIQDYSNIKKEVRNFLQEEYWEDTYHPEWRQKRLDDIATALEEKMNNSYNVKIQEDDWPIRQHTLSCYPTINKDDEYKEQDKRYQKDSCWTNKTLLDVLKQDSFEDYDSIQSKVYVEEKEAKTELSSLKEIENYLETFGNNS